jgi:ribosomal protein S18 acetylase RimI-like enzyme
MTLPIQETTTPQSRFTIRKAVGEDRRPFVETLVAAFHGDPVMTWWVPDAARRLAILDAFFEVIVDVNQPHDGLYVTEPEPVATAVWVPPGCQPTGDAADQLVARLVYAAAKHADRLLAALELMEEQHPLESHAYLFFLATRPEWQSRGLGSALMREVLDRCDRDGTPAYLEATSLDSRRLYLRHGFEVTAEIRLPDGPSMWPMWREPQGR